MSEALLFLLVFFSVLFVSRPLAERLRIPRLTVYLIAGILIGPAGLGLLKDVATLEYFYELGIILLLFSLGLEMKTGFLRRQRGRLAVHHFLISLLPAAGGFLTGLLLNRLGASDSLLLPLYLGSMFASFSVELIMPLFWEFSRTISRRIKLFSTTFVTTSILAEVTSLFLFSLLVTFRKVANPAAVAGFMLATAAFFVIVIRGLPLVQERVVRALERRGLGHEEQTRIVFVMLIIVVCLGWLLRLHPIVSAFLAGLALTRAHVDRRALLNIGFVTTNIFVPAVFIAIGARMDLSLLKTGTAFIYPAILFASMALVRSAAGFASARWERLPPRAAAGFGIASISQITGTLATAVAARRLGIVPPEIFNGIVIMCIVSTFIGPVSTQALLFPGCRRCEAGVEVAGQYLEEIRPIPLMAPLSVIIRRVHDTALSAYPVTDENDVFQGIIRFEDVKNLVFDPALDKLVIAADLLDRTCPVVSRTDPLDRAVEFFRKPGVSALPVIEETEEGNVYAGMLLLRDILPKRV